MKVVSFYNLTRGMTAAELLKDVEDKMEAFTFTPCIEYRRKSVGFVRSQIDGTYAPKVDGCTFLTIRIQEKKPNKFEVESLAAAKRLKIEESGQVVNKNMLKMLKEEAEQEILPATFPNEPKDFLVIFRDDGKVFVEGKDSKAEELLNLIRKMLGSLPVIPVEMDLSVEEFMAELISKPKGKIFTLEDEATFEDPEGYKHKISNGSLYGSEAKELVEDKKCEVLEMKVNWDGVVTMKINTDLVLTGLKFSKELLEDTEGGADILLATKEVRNIFDALSEVLTDKEKEEIVAETITEPEEQLDLLDDEDDLF